MTWDVVSSSTVIATVAATYLVLTLRVAAMDLVLGVVKAARWISTKGTRNA